MRRTRHRDRRWRWGSGRYGTDKNVWFDPSVPSQPTHLLQEIWGAVALLSAALVWAMVTSLEMPHASMPC